MEAINNHMEKQCMQCGDKIIEKHESALYECERCIGKHEN